MSVVKGKAFWAKLENPTNQFDPDKPRWSIDVSLDKEGLAVINEAGIPIKNKNDDRGQFASFRRDKFLSNGVELTKPRLIDAKKNDISGTLIGNGSVVKVSFYAKEYNVNGRQGVRGVLKDVQVLSLVPYERKDEFKEEEGFVSDTPTPLSAAPPTYAARPAAKGGKAATASTGLDLE